ncbi:MAG TPA: phage tail protein [Gaiellaceae bacterium]|nr:phage tail protein [Gaiellaceae bacterium]
MAGNGKYRTYGGGARKLGTASLQRYERAVNGHSPSVASERSYLRRGLPAIYQENDFGVRFVGSLEPLLDPIVALLDSLPAHVDPSLAPEDMLALLGNWLGLEVDEAWPIESKRELVRRGDELARRHGTRAGLELTLKIAFPQHPLRVEDSGSVTWAGKEAKNDKSGAGFVVYCDAPLDEHELGAVSRLIEQVKPVNVTYKLRVKAARSTSGS